MIFRLSEKVAKWMCRKNFFDIEDEEVCGYGIFWFFNIAEFFLLSLVCGIILSVIPGALAFYISFLLLRLFGGGFHLDSEIKCQISSFLIFVISIIAIRLTSSANLSLIMNAAAIILSPVIFIFCPVRFNSEELPESQIKTYKNLCRILTAAFIVLSVAAYFLKFYRFSSGLSLGIINESLLSLVGIIYNRAKSKI